MQFSGPQRGSQEQVVGDFYMAANEWLVDEGADTANHGLNLKGFVVCLDLKLSDYSSVPGVLPGMACCIPPTSANPYSYLAPLGVLLSDMILGSRKLTGEWVKVLMYGHCERIVSQTSADIATTDDVLYVNGLASGGIAGCTGLEWINSYTALAGAVSVTMDGNAGTAVINMNGDTVVSGASTSTWLTVPKATGVIGGAPDKALLKRFIGFHYNGDVPVQLQEYLNGTAPRAIYGDMRSVKGFVNCLGGIGNW